MRSTITFLLQLHRKKNAMKGRAYTCVNKSLYQAVESSPVVLLAMSPPPAVLSTLGNSKSAGIANAYADWAKKIDTTHKVANHVASTALFLSQNGLRSNLRESNFIKFHEGACSQTPLVFHAYACSIHITHPMLQNLTLKILHALCARLRTLWIFKLQQQANKLHPCIGLLFLVYLDKKHEAIVSCSSDSQGTLQNSHIAWALMLPHFVGTNICTDVSSSHPSRMLLFYQFHNYPAHVPQYRDVRSHHMLQYFKIKGSQCFKATTLFPVSNVMIVCHKRA